MVRIPDRRDAASVGDGTWAVHGGSGTDPGTGALRTPLVMANSYALPQDPSAIDWSGTDRLMYTRNGGVNQAALESKLAALEGAESAAVFATGVAALHGTFFALLSAGDHVIVSDVTYEAVWRLFVDLLPRFGVEATFVDVSDPDAVRAAFRPSTRLLHVETIANPTTRVADIAALAAMAHEHGVLLTVDSTFTPPPLYRPLGDGADLVVHSLTKFINGHGDAMGGAVLGGTELVERVRADALVDVGGVISPFNAWLILRGSVTLPLRLRQQMESAQRIAEFLQAQPQVAFVAFPGLATHPQHELALRQFGGRGYGGMLAFALDGDPDLQNRFVARLRVITSAFSLGHDDSLIVHVGSDARCGSGTYPDLFRRYGHLRLSVGLEDTDDLIDDLAQALDGL